LGTDFLRIAEDQIIKQKAMDTRLLLASFHEGGEDSIFEISNGGDTLNSYMLSYSWYIKFFHKDTPSAYSLGLAALNELR
jgi:hypothetical protein